VRRLTSLHRLAAASLGALLLTGVAPATASTPPPTASADGAAAPAVTTSGQFSVVSHASGSVVVWRPTAKLPHGDARVELAIDGVPVRSPLTRSADGALSLSLPGVTGLAPRQLSAVAAGRVLAGPGAQLRGSRAVSAAVQQPTKVLTKDPGIKGKHATTAFTYKAPSVRVGGFPVKTEVRARVVLPSAKTAKGERPVVVLLHGRHGTCYSAGGEETIDWPCAPGFKQTPSYLGYEYVQELLASQGYATVSISANGVNGQDFDAWDGGAEARAELVRHHLDLLARWNAKRGSGDVAKLKGRLKLSKVMFVGHSRGGEGVNRATVDLTGAKGVRVRGQVLIAPTDFGLQVSPGVPTTVLLPYCDGDVFDLQGQAYVDQGRYVTPGDRALKSAVMVFGANHNYFNTEWTPGLSKAPSFDDWWDPADATCGTSAKQRLTAKQQRAVGATYIAAAVRTVLSKDTEAVRLLDGSAVRARSAGKAVVRTAGYTGARRVVASATQTLRLRATRGMSAEACVSGFKDLVTSCEELAGEALSPHWLVFDDNAMTPWAQAVAMSWSKKGARLRITPHKARNLSSSRRLDLRVIAAGNLKSQSFDVVLTDTKGRTLTLKPEVQLDTLPGFAGMGPRLWAQTVRVTLPTNPKKFNLAKVRSFTIKATSAKGELFFLDAFTSRRTQPKPLSPVNVPRFEVQDTSAVVRETPSGTTKIDVTIKARGRAWPTSSRLAVGVASSTGEYTQRVVRVAPGTRTVKVPITVPADGVYTPGGGGFVTVTPLRNAAATSYLGTVDITSDVPVPRLTFPVTHVEVTQGQPVRWPMELSGLTSEMVLAIGAFVPTEAGLAELGSTHVPISVYTAMGLEPPAKPGPLSTTGLYLMGALVPLQSGGSFELPTRKAPALTAPRHVAFTVFPDDVYLSEPVTLTATINPVP